MSEYRFHLQKYRPGSKTTCPNCGKSRCFVRYIDEQGSISFPGNVGKCDHENSCGYHYTPKEYFKDNPDVLESECPFIVETFACDVEVLGTHFDVIANQAENRFSTALFSGRVAVTNKKNGESVILQPNDIVNLRDGGFQIQELEDKDDYLWMDGIISVYGMPFEQLMSKLERSYNVKIEIRRETMPVVKYKSLKIRVSDGIDHALHMLQLASDFTFEHDAVTDVIIIK